MELARWVARELMTKDALAAHARDELGISEITTARPIQAAVTSALTFSAGAILPLLAVIISPPGRIALFVSLASLGYLVLLGAVSARTGGADILKATIRVTFWGAFAMAITAAIGFLIGKSV
jgi:VIT1/CCC1 family predicted Fe2+/Mn2+ transporter